MEKFLEFIRENKVTTTFISKKLKVSVGAVQAWKTGINKPSVDNAYKIEKMTKGKVTVYDWCK
jgi:DNA-binding transcriptional regulator YiaG